MPNLEQTAIRAVTVFTNQEASLIGSGKRSYWATTHIVESGGDRYFTKQTTNPGKAEDSRNEPIITKVLSVNGIPCPKAYRFYEKDELLQDSLPTILYDYQESPTGVIQDGDDITSRGVQLPHQVQKTVGEILASIHQIRPQQLPNFTKGLDKNHWQDTKNTIATTTHLSTNQIETAMSLLERNDKDIIRLNHSDFYPANLLFDTNNHPNLLAIADWEKASLAPLGTDLLGIIAISSQLFTLADGPIESYRTEMNLSPENIKAQLLTSGLEQAILLADRLDKILTHDPNAESDPKVIKFQKWINDYFQFAYMYE